MSDCLLSREGKIDRHHIRITISLGDMGQLPCGPYFERKDFKELIDDMKKQDEYLNSPLRPVFEVAVHSFIHPKNPSNPASISTGVLTGGAPLWGFVVDDGTGYGDLYYYVYDTRVIEHREDSTWVVEHKDLVLVKAQLAVQGYIPNLKNMFDSAPKFLGGYTRFSPAMIHRACTFDGFCSTDPCVLAQITLKFTGCLHVKQPDVTESFNMAGYLLDVICDHRIRPPLSMPITLGGNEKIVSSSEIYLTGSCKLAFQDG
jgi:hypothetical protein